MLMARSGGIVLPIEGASAIAATATDSFGRNAFVQLAEPYRRQIKAHCYRMTGSLHEAEDLVQETYLRAWRAFESFEGRGSLKSWLYQIATRVCLDAITQRKKVRRLLPEANFPPATEVPTGQPRTDIAWLEPYPDSEVDDVADEAPNAEAQYVQRESVRLAFVAALQYLPPVSARCCCSSTCWVGLPPRPLR
jgi:RNA polymerase sigma-70 factor, ECF subfamily